tara:strand:+ start:179 stop:433 length:255 start_codon:yes stop_codon:yes gene_type:complete
MQKLINGVALLSGLVSLAVLGGGAYLYVQKDALIESATEAATIAATEAVTNALPGMVDGLVPDLPEATGGAIGMPAATGGAVPF